MSLKHLLNPSSFLARLSKLFHLFLNDPVKVLKDRHFYALVGLFGLFPLFKHTLKLISYSLRLRSITDFANLYRQSVAPNESSWVVVTGATAGLGKAFCQKFAELGFNIVAVSRSQERLDELELELLAINALSKIKKVQVDFTKTFRKHDLETTVINQLKDLDISILVNNVGVGECYSFNELNSAKIYRTVHTNVYPQIYLTQGLIPQLNKRSKTHKTGIINLSSNLGTEVILPYFSIYSATKAFNDHFSQALASEYPNIDILSARLGRTKTNMNPTAKTLPEVAVVSILKALGRHRETTGTISSYLEANVGPTMYWMVKRMIRKSVYAVYERKYRQDLIQNGDLPLLLA